MESRLSALTFDAREPRRLAAFWGRALARDPVDDGRAVLLPGVSAQVGLRFVASGSEKSGIGLVHLHVTAADDAEQRQVVEALLALGASHLDVGQLPSEGHVVLADPEGNELCVVQEGSFLAGCGPLGELACDGTRDVGQFWSAALGWPLVWDQDQETAIQSPHGGTKVAWGGPPLVARRGRARQRLDLVLDEGDLDAEVARLVGLGARVLGTPAAEDGLELADPDGNEFRLTQRAEPASRQEDVSAPRTRDEPAQARSGAQTVGAADERLRSGSSCEARKAAWSGGARGAASSVGDQESSGGTLGTWTARSV